VYSFSLDNWINRPNNYQVSENEAYIIWCSGIVIVENRPCDLLSLAQRAHRDQLDYNTLAGNFKLVIYIKQEQSYLFFGDNSGSQFLFMDDENARFSDSLLALRAQRGTTAQPNLNAVADLIEFDRIFGEKTLVAGIRKTCAEYYYRFCGGKFASFDKKLPSFSEMSPDIQFDNVLAPILASVQEAKICAVCTGGTDSRVILSGLVAHNISPKLLLTGHSDNPDIPIAQKIADTLKLPLTLVPFHEQEANWLEKSFCFLDGGYDVVLGYRHLKKARFVNSEGYVAEFGGVGGEFYKNNFCLPFRNGHIRNKKKHLRRILCGNGNANRACFADALRKAKQENADFFEDLIQKGSQEHSLLAACNYVGLEMIKSSSGAITNGYASVCCKVDPLVDRRLIGAVSHKHPWTLSMHLWQRKQIAKHCPKLSDIPTDQGYSCTVKPMLLTKERLKKLYFYAERIGARVLRKFGLRYRDAAPHYWDIDYKNAREDPLWAASVEYCKSVGILRSNVQDTEIPLAQTGILLQIGMLFHENFQNTYLKYNQSFLNENNSGGLL